MMILDDEMRRRLNLVLTSGTFLLRETDSLGEADVLSVQTVPDKRGIYWVPGETTLKSGQTVQSVFRVDTDSGGELMSVYWFVDEHWYEHQDADVYEKLGVAKDSAFPFDWNYRVELERDIYHN